MRALIAISSCELYRQNFVNDAVRETWVKDVAAVEGLDYVFFTGRDSLFEKPDEARLNVDDNYKGVTQKTVEGHRWALDYDYDFVFQTFPDVYIRPERLMAALQTDKDYVGYPMMATNGIPYASGGAGYWLSRKASELLLTSDVPYDWAEDRWVGQTMFKNRIQLYSDTRYSPIAQPPLARNSQITSHLSRPGADGEPGIYRAQWMFNTHKFWTLSQ